MNCVHKFAIQAVIEQVYYRIVLYLSLFIIMPPSGIWYKVSLQILTLTQEYTVFRNILLKVNKICILLEESFHLPFRPEHSEVSHARKGWRISFAISAFKKKEMTEIYDWFQYQYPQ